MTDTLEESIRFMDHVLTLSNQGRPVWYAVIETRRGDLHLRVQRRDFTETGHEPRWFGWLSLLSRVSAPPPYNKDCPPSRMLLEIDAQGATRYKMALAMKRRIAEAARLDVGTLTRKKKEPENV